MHMANEIQEPRRKNVLIDYERLRMLLGLGSYDEVRSYHKKWVDEYLSHGQNTRRDEWTRSIAVGSRSFVESVKALLGFRAKWKRGEH